MKRECIKWRGLFIRYYYLFFISILFSSCEKETNLTSEYVFKGNLIYSSAGNNLFTGTIKDTLSERILEYEVKEGKKNGMFIIYYSNGVIEMRGILKENKNEGKWYYYYPTGKIESEGFFTNDNVTDKWTWFYENGKIKETGFFIQGKPDGEWTSYDKEGNLKIKTIFRDGVKIDEIKIGNVALS